jgi:hypothetical protein
MRSALATTSRVLVVIMVLIIAIVFCLLWASSASGQYIVTVTPKVNVESGGSLSVVSGAVNGGQLDFGNMGPGQNQEKTVSLGITANDVWHLVVSKNQDLHDSLLDATIPSANFTFKSNGDAGPTYVTSNTEFGSSGLPSNVVTDGSATTSNNVNVVYSLTIPGDQPCNDPQASYYSAVHTYTLIVGSP